MANILIFGATSAIAQAVAKQYAQQESTQLFLTGRNADTLKKIADDLSVRGATTHIETIDATEFEKHASLIEKAQEAMGSIDIALFAHGTLPDQQACEQDVKTALDAIAINATSIISMLTILANTMETQGKGTIAVISSVAGDRGRQSNYVYGTAKASVSVFLQGLRNRLTKKGVHVLTIKPGFVDTPMTAEFDKGALWATPEKVANDIINGINKQKNVVYTPWFWQYIMLIIKNIPEFIFKKLSL